MHDFDCVLSLARGFGRLAPDAPDVAEPVDFEAAKPPTGGERPPPAKSKN
jgi:hypothetical protein